VNPFTVNTQWCQKSALSYSTKSTAFDLNPKLNAICAAISWLPNNFPSVPMLSENRSISLLIAHAVACSMVPRSNQFRVSNIQYSALMILSRKVSSISVPFLCVP
jgi:hypothetical protein